jgi:hypothetical protein
MEGIFSNREIATIVWLGLFLIIAMFNRGVRKSFKNVIKTLFSWKIIVYCISSIMYFLLLLYLINKIVVLDLNLVKDSVFWFLPSGLALTANSFSSKSEKDIIKKHILENVKFTIFIEFIIATYVFPLLLELVLIPFIVVVSMLSAISENKEEYQPVNKLLNKVQGFIGYFILGFSVYSAICDYNHLIGFASIKSVLLPLVLAFLNFPFSYLWILYAKYEELFTVINVIYSNKRKVDIGTALKKRILAFSLLSYNRVNDIRSNKYFFWNLIEDKYQIDEFIEYNKKKIKKDIL